MIPQTKLISLTYPNNPTGSMISEETLEEVIELVESFDCCLIFDETYRELTFQNKLPTASSLSHKAISISTLSKEYGLPGIRIGWMALRDKSLMESFIAVKEQINICNSVVDEEIAHSVLKNKEQFIMCSKGHIQASFKIVNDWIKINTDLEYIQPKGGAVCFPKTREDRGISLSNFYSLLRHLMSQRFKGIFELFAKHY